MADQPSQTLLERAGSTAASLSELGSDNPRARRAIEIGAGVLVAAFLIGFIATQWGQLPDYDWEFRPGWLAASAVAVALFYAIQCEAWLAILRSLGEHLHPRAARAVWGKSLIARYVPTNALMVVGRVVMAERYGVTKRGCLASIVYELALAVVTAVMVGAYFVITLPRLEEQPARYAILVVIPLAFVVLHPRIFKRLADFALRKLGRAPLPATLPFGRVIQVALIYLAGWVTMGLAVVAFASALHPLATEDVAYAAAAYPVAFCAAVLVFVIPGGLGARDAALAVSLAAVLPGAVATAIAVAFRIFQTVVELLYVAVVTARGRGS
ncbi:MAG TPA: lysylphosphatidylglycerol synthase domain-containing protein [Thermoleophilaceae bacterium]|nr:lysylphosphatidylglycerol synthase domain-containing protein [Thermoleophilaceae bacterium]